MKPVEQSGCLIGVEAGFFDRSDVVFQVCAPSSLKSFVRATSATYA